MMNRNIIETIMGAVVLAVASFFIVFAYKSSGMEKREGTTFKADFDRIDGLVVGTDVRMSGVKIGTVLSLTINPKTYLAQATFIVDRNIPLPKDSSAEIVSSGLLGDKYLALVPGGDDENLKEGDQIMHTQSSISLESMIGQLLFSSKSDKKKDKDKNQGSPSPKN